MKGTHNRSDDTVTATIIYSNEPVIENPSPELAAAVYFKKGYDAAVQSTILWMIHNGVTNIDLKEYQESIERDYKLYHERKLSEDLGQ